MIVFLDYQYKGVGGVGQLVVNLTYGLNRIGHRPKIYCSEDSYEYRRLMQMNSDFEWINSDSIKVKELSEYISKNDTIFLSHIFNSELLSHIKAVNCRIIFYSVHPDTFFCYPPYFQRYVPIKLFALKFIKKLLKHDGLIFMDEPNVEGIKRRGYNTYNKYKYLRIPTFSETKKIRTKLINDQLFFYITYLGRGNSYWKVYPVIKIIQDLNNIKGNFCLSIITDKNEWFQQLIEEYIPNNIVRIEYVNGLSGAKLENYLYSKSNLHIAMGTSALEGAKLGIPTLLIDYSNKLFPDNYLYKWLYKLEGNSLGNDISNLSEFDGDKLENIITCIKNDFCSYSESTIEYINKHHSLSNIVDQFVQYADQSKMCVSDYCSTSFSFSLLYLLPIASFVHDKLRMLVHGLRKLRHLFPLRVLGLSRIE